MSPRVQPRDQRGLSHVSAPPPLERHGGADVQAIVEAEAERRRLEPGGYHRASCDSYFRDRLLVAESEARSEKALQSPVLRGRDQGDPDRPDALRGLEEARARLKAWMEVENEFRERRDLSSSTAPDALRPSAPGWIADEFGRASRSQATLAAALGPRPLEEGMVDTVGGVPTVSLPRLVTGAATAVQTAQNAAVTELDPTTGSVSSPLATIAGQVDMSRQLFDFSRPGLDEAISDDLGRDFGQRLDAQIISGSAAAGQLRGLANTTGTLAVTNAGTTAATQASSIWSAFSSLAGASGFGTPDPNAYLTILHPRRYAFLQAGGWNAGGALNLPGTVVASGGIRTNLGAGTNEDEVYVLERSNVILSLRQVAFRVFPEIGSSTLTVRVSAWGTAALLVKNPAGVARVSGALAPPTF